MKKKRDTQPLKAKVHCSPDGSHVGLSEARQAYGQFLEAIGIGHALTDLAETARLSSELLVQLTSGVRQPVPALSLIEHAVKPEADWIILDDIPFYSLCEHHFVPFFGHAKIEYRPLRWIAGLGGFVRIVDHFSKQPQLQERLTEQIGRTLVDQLEPLSLRVTLKARQMCVELKGMPAIHVETHFEFSANEGRSSLGITPAESGDFVAKD